jgi:coatomer subunit beta'
VDFHPTEPWLLTGLYNGSVNIYNHETGAIVKTFEVAEVPVRCVKFIARKNWFVAGSDDFQLRVFNYNTHEKVTSFEAHPDYIRCLTVHPSTSIVLTGRHDNQGLGLGEGVEKHPGMLRFRYRLERLLHLLQVYEGHTHYIMNLAFNPKDGTYFRLSMSRPHRESMVNRRFYRQFHDGGA